MHAMPTCCARLVFEPDACRDLHSRLVWLDRTARGSYATPPASLLWKPFRHLQLAVITCCCFPAIEASLKPALLPHPAKALPMR